jgi:hypothetical protein
MHTAVDTDVTTVMLLTCSGTLLNRVPEHRWTVESESFGRPEISLQ